jgi:hypothetical protein
MEIKGRNWSKCKHTELKWILFLCIRMKGVFFEDFVRLHSVGEVVLHYVMFLLRKNAWQ